MNDSTTPDDASPCESRAEDISLLAAGCLTIQEERDLYEHLATCDACRKRYEYLQLVCSELRTAKPASDAFRFKLSSAKAVGANTRQRRWLIAACVAGVFVMVSLLNINGQRPAPESPSRAIDVAQESPTRTEPDEPTAHQQPSLLALRQAAAESDEALDRLLAQTSVPMFSDPINAQSLWLESQR